MKARILGLALLASACRAPSVPGERPLVLRGATLIDATGREPLRDAVVVIERGRITQLGTSAEIVLPEETIVRDLTGKWIVPGLIDAHTHLLDSASLYTSPDDYDLGKRVPHEQERRRIRARIDFTLSRYLCAGVTTVASLGGASWELALREGAPSRRKPRLAVTGPFLSSFPVGEVTLWTRDDPVLVQVASAEEARRLVSELAGRKVDLIKAGFAAAPGVSLQDFLPIFEALVREAHARGLRVAVHAEELDSATALIAAGADVLAHTVVDKDVDDRFLTLAREQGVSSITGLSHFERYAQVLEERVELLPIERRCGDPDVIETWKEIASIPPEERPEMPASIRWGSSSEARAILLSNLRRLEQAGVTIAVGSNGGNIGTLHGASYHRELAMMAEAGLTPEAILLAATRGGAEALGVLSDRGTVEVGKAADLLALDADPLESEENLSAIHAVVIDGIWLDEQDLR